MVFAVFTSLTEPAADFRAGKSVSFQLLTFVSWSEGGRERGRERERKERETGQEREQGRGREREKTEEDKE